VWQKAVTETLSQPHSRSMGSELWGVKFRIELAGDTGLQIRDGGHSIGVKAADGRLDFLRFSLFGR
jgi:hypothetical protein